MFATTLAQLREVRTPVRALLGVYWVYALATGLTSVFTQIYFFERFESVSLNIIVAMVSYTGVMVGFCVPGLAAAIWQQNLKNGFLWSL